MDHKMAFFRYCGIILMFMAVNHGQSYGFMPSDGASRVSSYSLPSFRNLSSYSGEIGSGLKGDSLPNSPLVNTSRIINVFRKIFDAPAGIINTFRKIFDAPALKLTFRVIELYGNETEPIDILYDILPSPDMQELISICLSRTEVPAEQITAVQGLVTSTELKVLIGRITSENESSPTETLCAVHYFTKLPEFRLLLEYIMNVSPSNELPDIPQLNQLKDTLNQLAQYLNLDESGITEILFSPVSQTFLDVFCKLGIPIPIPGIPNLPIPGIPNLPIPDIPNLPIPGIPNLPIPDIPNLPGFPNIPGFSNDVPKSEAQALSSVANITNASPDELLNQLQAIITSPDLAQVINNLNLNTSLNINELISQIGAAVASGNISALQQILTQFQNGSLGNETSIADLVTQLTQQANATVVVVLPLVTQYIGNVWRSALTDNGVSEACQDSTMVYIEALLGTETWALQFLDAYGKIPSALLSGSLKWLGSFDECTGIESTGAEKIKGKYCRAVFPLGDEADTTTGFTLGTCVPNSCSASDSLGILLMAQKLMLNGTTPLVPSITCVEEKEFETDAIIVTCVLVVFGFIVLCGTLYDVVSVQMKSEKVKEIKPTSGLRESLSSTATSSSASTSGSDLPASLYKPMKTMLDTFPGLVNNAFTSGDEFTKNADDFTDIKNQASPNDEEKKNDVIVNIPNSKEETSATPSTVSQRGVLENVMLSFSAYTNGAKILSTNQASGSLGSINGIRFLSMAWVILGHTYVYGLDYDDNLLPHYLEKMNHWTFASITYATVSVDSFFTISGILVGYLTLRHLKKVGGALKMNWFMFYFHRFWRLTPPYMLIMMVATVILPYVATGPMWNGDDFPGCKGCRKYWWTNLLYVNNYVNTDDGEMCMGWTWYLANDMQFYILSPLILLPLFYNVIAGLVSGMIFLAGTIITTAVIVHKYEYSAQENNFDYAPIAVDEESFKRIYIPSYARMGPYVIGLFTGYLLYRLDCKCRIPRVLNLLGWLLCLAICCCDVYGLYSYEDDHILTQLQSDVFLALHRTGWGVAISWIVFACATGHGGWINEFLSWKPFIPLGRLTYGAYLLHPLVIYLFMSTRHNPTFFSDYEVVYLFIGHVTLAYGAAFVVSLFFESPMMGLEKVFFNPQKKK